jgi:excisionase family DNA binding protein
MTQLGAQLITAPEAAELLNVHVRTVHGWIEKGTIPYVTLPSNGGKNSYRIPLHGLLSSLSGNYDLAGEVEAFLAQ